MAEINLLILVICLLLYVILGGADFGGGILELLTRGKASRIVSRAIAPIWEANHVWLILVVVILFVGFPSVYSTILTSLHIPVLLVLIGIIFRGSAFTFRHYDIDEATTQKIYSRVFQYSSLFTTFFLGVTLGGIILGNITLDYNVSFYDGYLRPWLNWFSMSMGLFMVLLFAFLAGIFTVSELSEEKDLRYFTTISRRLIVAIVLVGAMVFVAAQTSGHPLFFEFLHSPASMVAIILATLELPLLWILLNRNSRVLIRLIAGFQTTMIVTGWFAIQFPVLVKIKDGPDITLQSAGAPPKIQFFLFLALLVGVLIIFPSIAYLYKVFKFGKEPES